MEISNQRIKSISITKLKQLENVECSFEPNALTAILGVNGCGKSTILHAIACCFQPLEKGENHRFSNFFLPNNLNAWEGSTFTICYSYIEGGTEKEVNKEFKKTSDRWTRYVSRPIRDVFYLGIDSCVPDIEKEKARSRITIQEGDKNEILNRITDKINYIFGGNYQCCKDGVRNKKKYRIVENGAVKYPSIAMGAGEQRLLTILEVVFAAPKNSLILIDELDLTLHTQAFNRLLDVLIEQSRKEKLQIIFTTHRETVTQRTDINIRHIFQANGKTFCFEGVNNACMDVITGSSQKKIKIFVEDKFSKCIVNTLAIELKIQRYCEIQTFGDICNGFTIASAKAVENKDLDDIIIVLDGDKYSEEEDKKTQLSKRFSGNTQYEKDIRIRALGLIKEYMPNNSQSPEKFAIELLKDLDSDDDEIIDIVKGVGTLLDDHDYVDEIAGRLGVEKDAVMERIISKIKNTDEWSSYTKDIKEWLETRKNELTLTVPH